MKTRFLFITIVTFLSILGSAAAQSSTNWGITKAEVKAIETRKLLKDTITEDGAGFLAYEGKTLKLDGHTFYFFSEGKLSFVQDYLRPEQGDCMKTYDLISRTLQEKFGKPLDIKENWKDESYKRNPSQKASAVHIGKLEMLTTWETPTTRVTSIMNGDGSKVHVAVNYNDKLSMSKEKR